jgi:hypothetical protein
MLLKTFRDRLLRKILLYAWSLMLSGDIVLSYCSSMYSSRVDSTPDTTNIVRKGSRGSFGLSWISVRSPAFPIHNILKSQKSDHEAGFGVLSNEKLSSSNQATAHGPEERDYVLLFCVTLG